MKSLLFIILILIIFCTLFSIFCAIRLRNKMLKSLDNVKFLTNLAKAERIFYESTLNKKLIDYKYLYKYVQSTISALNYHQNIDDLNSVDNSNILNERIKSMFEKIEIAEMDSNYRKGLLNDLQMSRKNGEKDLKELFIVTQEIILYGLKQKGKFRTIISLKKIKPLQNLREIADYIHYIIRYKLAGYKAENKARSSDLGYFSGVSLTVYQN